MCFSPSGRRATAGPADDARRELPEMLERTALVDQLPAILYVAEAGIDGQWQYVSYGVTAILGFSQREWMADPGLWARQLHPEDRERVLAREDGLLEPAVPEEYRIRHRDGTIV